MKPFPIDKILVLNECMGNDARRSTPIQRQETAINSVSIIVIKTYKHEKKECIFRSKQDS